MKKHQNNSNDNVYSESLETELENTNNPFATTAEDKTIDKEEQIESKEEVNEIEEKFNKLQNDYNNLNNQYIRLAADFDNYRKRQAQEKEAWLRYGTEDALRKMLEVLDNFDRAKKSLDNSDNIEQVKEACDILHKQVCESLEKIGLKTINTENVEFDPNYHEAVMQTQSSEHKENFIINELQKGYQFGDKVLRPSLVNVAVSE